MQMEPKHSAEIVNKPYQNFAGIILENREINLKEPEGTLRCSKNSVYRINQEA